MILKNWSQKLEWKPADILYPTDEAAIQQSVLKALGSNKKIRVIGSVHSFNPLWVTDQIVISLENFQGIISLDKTNLTATVKAGTKLHHLGDLLFEQGMAMENLGDIDRQSIGGTISTGTHGTGINFGTISTQVIALKFINGLGEIVNCSLNENKDLFKAAQVSLGALGIITEITLQCVPAYKLELQNRKEDLETVLSTFNERINNNRNFEFYWFPKASSVWSKTSNIVNGQPDKVGILNYATEYVLENYAYKLICETARLLPSTSDSLSRFSAAVTPNVSKVYHSHKVYATTRLVRFNEMEYNVPIEIYPEAMKEIIKIINKNNFNIVFPLENRVVKSDDVYLSPAYQRTGVYVSCHVYNKKDYEPYFKALEEIFLHYDGRPHWAKLHTLTAKELVDKYPKFNEFNKHREVQDPHQIFMNDYLKKLLIVQQ